MKRLELLIQIFEGKKPTDLSIEKAPVTRCVKLLIIVRVLWLFILSSLHEVMQPQSMR